MRTGLCLALILMLAPPPGLAEEAKPEAEGSFRILTEVTPPDSPSRGKMAEEAQTHGFRAEMRYVDGLKGDLASGREERSKAKPPPQGFRPPVFSGNAGLWVVLLLVIGGLALWLRFGGAGGLLRRAPEEGAPAPRGPVPEAWAISEDDRALGPEALIARLLALPDRGLALAGLLRHSLLRAADETRIRLARADTEREAFARLPGNWRLHAPLKTLLREAEEAHYGARPVDDEKLQRLAAIARAILTQGAPSHA